MSSAPAAPATPATEADTRPRVTVLSGLWSASTYAVARALLAADPSLLLVRCDLTSAGDGYVRRIMRSGADRVDERRGALRPGGVPQALREDVLPALARMARTQPSRHVVLMLPAVAEPEAVTIACAGCLVDGVPLPDLIHVDSYVTVVHAEYLLDGLNNGDDLVTLGIQAGDDDHRSLADVVVRQIEHADTLVLWGSCAGGPFDTAQAYALLHHLAPWAACLHVAGDLIDATDLARRLLDSHRHRPELPGVRTRGIEGYALGVHDPHPTHDVVSAAFRARRPFHPERLHDMLETVNAGVLRSRGHLWLASQPDTVVAWDFAGGGLALRALGRWLAAVPEDQWHGVSDQRWLAASVEWHPYYDDRHHYLIFIGIDLDAAKLHQALSRCLLTDAELADGEAVWRTYNDPFAGCFPLPDPHAHVPAAGSA